jgi:DNA-binding NarL/FixJ family response regulator
MVRVLVADDDDLQRTGLRLLLARSADIVVSGEAVDGQDAVRRSAELKPDVVIMDISMPRANGIEATAEIIKKSPSTQVLIVSQLHQPGIVSKALQAGARGYVLKTDVFENLAPAVHAVAQGERYFSPGLGSGKPI